MSAGAARAARVRWLGLTRRLASILFVTWDGGGNLPPALGSAAELRDRGEQVRYLATLLPTAPEPGQNHAHTG